MVDFVGLGILLLVTLLLGWLVWRAWGSKNNLLKWVGVVLAGLLTLIFAAVFILAIIGTSKLNANYNASNPPSAIKVAATPEQLAFGQKYAKFCAGCHSPDQTLPLRGNNFGAEFPAPIGTLYAPNLTSAGEIKDWSDGEIIRAIREGIHKSGRPLIIMPAEEFKALSDEDVQGVVAYLRSQPAVEPNTPPNNLNVLGAIFVNLGLLTNQAYNPNPVPKPAVAPNAEYGKYLQEIMACSSCHGENLTGGTSFDGSQAPNLTLVIPQWSQDEFITAIRTGVVPGGKTLDPAKMPWKDFSDFATDTDLQALYQYLHGLPPTQAPAK